MEEFRVRTTTGGVAPEGMMATPATLPGGLTVAELIDARRSAPGFAEMRREYRTAGAAVIDLAEVTLGDPETQGHPTEQA